ncbi:MAG: ABC transporter permease [Chitinophagaceae bacterium]
MQHTIIESKKGKGRFDFKEFIKYKDLLYFMVLRDVTVVYKQSVLGFAWAVINPVFSMLVFTIVFGRLAGVPSDGIPYPIFSYAALIPWTYFSNTLNTSGTSLINNSSIFTKVYFPRLIIPLTPVLSKLVDLSISFILLLVLMIYYQFFPTFKIFLILPLIVLLVMTAAGMGSWLSALALQYRDVKFGITFAVPLLMYAAPVVFPASLIMQKLGYKIYLLYGLYPLTGIIEGFRAAVIPSKAIPWDLIGMSAIGAILIFTFGLFVFKRFENRFADVA